jgi:hypothetical protein
MVIGRKAADQILEPLLLDIGYNLESSMIMEA